MPHSENPSAVPSTMPVISPMAQPVRQWSVALKATRSSARPLVGRRAMVVVVIVVVVSVVHAARVYTPRGYAVM